MYTLGYKRLSVVVQCQVEGQANNDFNLFLVENIENLIKTKQNEALAKACFCGLKLYLCRIALFAYHNCMYTSGYKGLSVVMQRHVEEQAAAAAAAAASSNLWLHNQILIKLL